MGAEMPEVAVTGGCGRLGQAVMRQAPADWSVRSIDRREPEGRLENFRRVDVCDFPALTEALAGTEAVIHLSAIPNPLLAPEEEVFRVNACGTNNVRLACEKLGIGRIVFASSVCYHGFVFQHELFNPPYFPIDEDSPTFAEDSYSLSKLTGEETLKAFARRAGGAALSLRFSLLVPDNMPATFTIAADAQGAKELWAYVYLRDAAAAVWQALAFLEGRKNFHEAFIITADDTRSTAPTRELITRFYPAVTDLRFNHRLEDLPFCALYANRKARARLGFRPADPEWRNPRKG